MYLHDARAYSQVPGTKYSIYIYAERNKIIDMLEKTMQKPSIPLISCKLFNLYQDVKLNKYSLYIAYLFNSLSIEPII